MQKEQTEVSDDNIFLSMLIEKHGISPKQIAGWTGRGCSTIYKYLSGELTIPSVVFRSIYERTLDPVVFTLIRGDLPVVVAPLVSVNMPPDGITLQRLIEMRQTQLCCEKCILGILADGKVDEADAMTIANYKMAFDNSIIAQTQIYQAILNTYKKAEAAKNV